MDKRIKVQYDDPSVLSLNILDLVSYLEDTGWQLVKRDPFFVFDGENDDNGKLIQIVLSRGDDKKDVYLRIAGAINLLSVIEDRPQHEIIKAIKGRNLGLDQKNKKSDLGHIHLCCLCGKEINSGKEWLDDWVYLEYTDGDIFEYCPAHSIIEIINDTIGRADPKVGLWSEVEQIHGKRLR